VPIQSGSLIRSLLAAVTVTSCMMFSVAPAQAQTPAAPAAASETVAATAAPATPAPAAADASAKKADEKAENPYGPMAM